MANRARGEVSIQVGRKRYTLRPTISAYCELEDLLNKTHVEVMTDAARGSAKATRALLWSYLQAKHADEIDTVEKAGALVDEVGMLKIQEQMKALDEANQPSGDASGDSADPPRAQVGTGRDSTGARAALA